MTRKTFTQTFVTAVLAFAFPVLMTAQHRYFDPVFSQVKLTPDVTYGINATILFAAPPPNGYGHALRMPLKMDVYEPAGDTAQARPLVILLHSGNFLPPQVNGGCCGTKLDGEVVELASRLSKRGFVVAAVDYRLGWNPLASTYIERGFTYVNAVNRGVQDSRTCIRYFRKDNAGVNQFRIDPEKITLWGLGTGGTISMASATLDTITDMYTAEFVTPGGPMVNESFNGNFDATSLGVVPLVISPYGGDTLCYPNHVGYSSDFALGVNMMGMLLDTAWLDAGDVPLLSFACPAFSNAQPGMEPCGVGYFGYIPTGCCCPTFSNVAGSCAVQERQAALGKNAVWTNAGFDDPLSLHSLTINGGIEGFYPFLESQEYAPWAFSDTVSPYGVSGVVCDTNFLSAGTYLDTVMQYFAPRACALLQLNANCNAPVVALKESIAPVYSLDISPNPAHDAVHVTAGEPMLAIELYDLRGRLVWRREGLNASEITIQRGDWPAGVYWVRARCGAIVHAKMVVWQ